MLPVQRVWHFDVSDNDIGIRKYSTARIEQLLRVVVIQNDVADHQ